MVAPITGPINRSGSLLFPGSTKKQYRFQSSSWRQAQPYDLSLAYSVRKAWAKILVPDHSGKPVYGADDTWAQINGTGLAEASSKAYADFTSKATSATLGWSENLAQRQQAARMMTDRVVQLTRFVKAVNRGDLWSAWKELRLPHDEYTTVVKKWRLNGQKLTWSKLPDPRRNHRPADLPVDRYKRSRAIADLILEFNFGWRPLIEDIYGAISLLTSDPPKGVIVGRGSSPLIKTKWNSGSFSPRGERAWKAYAQYRAEVSVSNPNVALWAQAGLTNPALLAFQLIPGSFLFDWVTNLSQVIEGYTRLWGLSLTNVSYSTKVDFAETVIWNNYGWSGSGQGFEFKRSLTLPRPALYRKSVLIPSLTRAANAVSLLIQALPKR